jgi:hypothetical protein
MSEKRRKRWFWAWLVVQTIAKDKLNQPKAMSEIWKNLVLVEASDASEAYQKAVRLGKAEEGDCGGTLRLNGRPAKSIFLGLGGLGLVHEEISDGVEIMWKLRRCSVVKARSFVKTRNELIDGAQKELSH